MWLSSRWNARLNHGKKRFESRTCSRDFNNGREGLQDSILKQPKPPISLSRRRLRHRFTWYPYYDILFIHYDIGLNMFRFYHDLFLFRFTGKWVFSCHMFLDDYICPFNSKQFNIIYIISNMFSLNLEMVTII